MGGGPRQIVDCGTESRSCKGPGMSTYVDQNPGTLTKITNKNTDPLRKVSHYLLIYYAGRVHGNHTNQGYTSQHLNYHNGGIDAKKVISISELFSNPLEDVENWA